MAYLSLSWSMIKKRGGSMIHIVSNFTSRLSFFAIVGALSGALVGNLFKRSQTLIPNMAWIEALEAGFALSTFAWLCMLLLFGIWLRYTVKQIWIQTLIVTILTGLSTTCILHIWFTHFAGLLGLIIGMIIGTILTMLCRLIYNTKKEACL